MLTDRDVSLADALSGLADACHYFHDIDMDEAGTDAARLYKRLSQSPERNHHADVVPNADPSITDHRPGVSPCPECGQTYLAVTGPRADPDAIHHHLIPTEYCEYETANGGGYYVHAWL